MLNQPPTSPVFSSHPPLRLPDSAAEHVIFGSCTMLRISMFNKYQYGKGTVAIREINSSGKKIEILLPLQQPLAAVTVKCN